MPSRHALVLGALWVVAATAATSVGVVAVRLVDNRVGEPVAAPLTSSGVRAALGSVPPTAEPTEPAPRPTEDSSDEGAARTVTTAGGVVSARCTDGRPTLLYATPADGYRTVRGSSTVRFVGRTRQVTLTLSCHDDELRVATRTDRTGTTPRPATTPAPVRTTHAPEPSERPEPSETPHEDSSGGLETHSSSDD
jgi:hypothetical protein